ncbi:MAG: hypothetical protein IJ054_09505 [Lachnospiraceae bacterium]|nr:hypothetical protein [Lachnospiraceae bacterium]
MNFETFIEEIKSDNEVPEVVDLKIEETLGSLSKKKTKRNSFFRTPFKRYAIAFALVFICVAAVSVSAQSYIYWPGVIEDRFSLDFFDKVILENGGFTMNQRIIGGESDILYAESDGVAISVTQTVADSDNVFVGLYITGLEEYAGRDLILDFDVLIDGKEPPGKEVHSFIYDEEKNCAETYIEIDSYYDEILDSVIDKKIILDIKSIRIFDSADDMFLQLDDLEIAAKGVWHFEWTLSGGDTKKEWTISKEIGDTGMIMTYVRATPIGLYIEFISGSDSIDYSEDFFTEHYLYGIRLLDGSYIYNALASGVFGWAYENDYDFFIDFNLETIINPEEISALLFIKDVMPDEENPSEGYFYVIELE